MGGLITTNARDFVAAELLFQQGRWPSARLAFEQLVERAQENGDSALEVRSRAMVARCMLPQGETDGAAALLELARKHFDVVGADARLCWWAAKIRTGIAQRQSVFEELKAYSKAAEEAEAWRSVVDAAELAALVSPEARVYWLERAFHFALEHLPSETARCARALALALEDERRFESARDAWEQVWFGLEGQQRARMTAAWAAGSLSCQLQDWPDASRWLELCVEGASQSEDCGDLLALAMADLARVHEASGDVVEARRTLLQAIKHGRDYDLAELWPARWAALVRHAQEMGLDPYETSRRS